MELLVVISIIGLLAGLGLPAINGAIKAGKKAEVVAMAESIKTAVNAFYAEYSTYPANSNGVVFTKTDVNFFGVMCTTTNTNGGNYRGIAFLEVPPKFINATNGLVTPQGFLIGKSDNFNIGIDTNGAGVQTNQVGGKSFTNAASVVVWVSDPSDKNKPVGTFK